MGGGLQLLPLLRVSVGPQGVVQQQQLLCQPMDGDDQEQGVGGDDPCRDEGRPSKRARPGEEGSMPVPAAMGVAVSAGPSMGVAEGAGPSMGEAEGAVSAAALVAVAALRTATPPVAEASSSQVPALQAGGSLAVECGSLVRGLHAWLPTTQRMPCLVIGVPGSSCTAAGGSKQRLVGLSELPPHCAAALRLAVLTAAAASD